MDWITLDPIEVEIDRKAVARIVGARSGGGTPAAERIAQRIDSAIRLAGRLIAPAAIYTLTEGRCIEGPPVFEMLEEMALCVCTIGDSLEKKAEQLSAEGSLLEALVLDTAGSEAVESTADYVNGRINEIAHREGKRTSLRASPGYGNWDIKDQKGIFRIAPTDRIGVTLGEGIMMKPKKSISFAVHISENPVRLRSANDCGSCDRRDCPYRKRL